MGLNLVDSGRHYGIESTGRDSFEQHAVIEVLIVMTTKTAIGVNDILNGLANCIRRSTTLLVSSAARFHNWRDGDCAFPVAAARVWNCRFAVTAAMNHRERVVGKHSL